MKSKEIYQSIDQSKLKKVQGGEKAIANLKRVEKETKGFTVENPKFDVAMGRLYDVLKDKNPEVLKNVKVEEKVKEVKVPTTKTEQKKDPKKKTKTVKKKVKKATGKKKVTKPTKTPSTPKEKKVPFSTRAKQLADKEGITFKEARVKLSKQLKEEKTKIEKSVKSDLDKLLAFVKSDKFEDGERYPKTYGQQTSTTSNVSADAQRKAKPVGRRVSEKEGETTNQYGTFKNKKGRVYYESRDNRSDRNSLKAPQGQYKYKGKTPPYLEAGGVINSVHAVHIKDNMSLLNASKKYSNVKMDKPPLGSIVGQTYVTIDGKRQNLFVGDKYIAKNKQIIEVYKPSKGLYMRLEAGGTLPTPFGQAGLVGETGTMNEMDMFAMGGDLPQGVHQYYAQTYNPAYPTPHGYAKGGKVRKSPFKVGDMVYSYQNPNDKMRVSFVEDRGVEDGVDYGWGYKVSLKTDEDGKYDPKGKYSQSSKWMSQNSMSKTKKTKYAKGGMVSDKRQRVAELLVQMDYDNGFYDEELDREYGTTTVEEAIQWELENRVKTDKDADYYIVKYDFAKGGVIDAFNLQFIKDVPKTNLKVEQIDNKISYAKGGRTKSATNRDRKYFNSSESWEKSVDSKGRKRPTYKKRKSTKSQGFNDRLDESLGETRGAKKTKKQSYKSRRKESEGMEKSMGRRKYSRVKTMDKGNREKRMPKKVKVFKSPQLSTKTKEMMISEDGRKVFIFENGMLYRTDNMGNKTQGQKMKETQYEVLSSESFADGGKIGFDALSKKVAKRYYNKAVPKKFQKQYGKTYSKAEAMEVGKKVAGKVYRQQQLKK